jgi:predicted HicB family RNase H-like nuclease
MTDKLTYKGFTGCVHFCCIDEIFFGKIEGINDLVTYEGQTLLEIIDSFEEAVYDYIYLLN